MDRNLNPDDKKRIIDLYEGRLAQFGCDVRTVGWGSKEDQWLRFSILCRGLELTGKRILDVGCGLGDLVAFLDDQGYGTYTYVGVDIAPLMVKEAQRLHGGPGRSFIVADLLENSDIGEFDVVLSSGALSFRVHDNLELAKLMLTKMFAICRDGVAVNFLSSYVDYQQEKNFHYSPEAIFSFARSITRWVRLHHDYPLYEFTVQLFHNANANTDVPVGGSKA